VGLGLGAPADAVVFERVNQLTSIRTATTFSTATNPNFISEDVIAYETGYRAQPTDAFVDVALYFNAYRNLRVHAGSQPGPPFGPTPPFSSATFRTRCTAKRTRGMTATWQVQECWKLYAAYSFLQMQPMPTRTCTATGIRRRGRVPKPQNQLYVQSSHDTAAIGLDLIGRYVDVLSHFAAPPNDTPVPSYIEMDVRWHTCRILLGVRGRRAESPGRSPSGIRHESDRGGPPGHRSESRRVRHRDSVVVARP
jgi:hypothetical protein